MCWSDLVVPFFLRGEDNPEGFLRPAQSDDITRPELHRSVWRKALTVIEGAVHRGQVLQIEPVIFLGDAAVNAADNVVPLLWYKQLALSGLASDGQCSHNGKASGGKGTGNTLQSKR